jgi:hypothetical protein
VSNESPLLDALVSRAQNTERLLVQASHEGQMFFQHAQSMLFPEGAIGAKLVNPVIGHSLELAAEMGQHILRAHELADVLAKSAADLRNAGT